MTKIVDPAIMLDFPINPVYDFNFDVDREENTESFYEIYSMENDTKQIAGMKRIDWKLFTYDFN